MTWHTSPETHSKLGFGFVSCIAVVVVIVVIIVKVRFYIFSCIYLQMAAHRWCYFCCCACLIFRWRWDRPPKEISREIPVLMEMSRCGKICWLFLGISPLFCLRFLFPFLFHPFFSFSPFSTSAFLSTWRMQLYALEVVWGCGCSTLGVEFLNRAWRLHWSVVLYIEILYRIAFYIF